MFNLNRPIIIIIKVIPAKIWGTKNFQIEKKINKFGTYQNQMELEEKEKSLKSKHKKGKKG